MRKLRAGIVSAAAVLLLGGTAAAQGISITPSIGAYIPASDFYDLRDEADRLRVEKDGTFALGLAVELGWLRGTLAYASGATLRGVDTEGGREEIGDGTLLLGAADLVLRPIPRLVVVQPYLLGGIGFRNASYDTDRLESFFPEDDRETALHIGLGADLMLGRIGIVAELTDFISRDADDKWGEHDAFATVGLKFRLGGR